MASKVALVTAGSAGLGAAICRALHNTGTRIVVNYAGNRERAEALVAELQQSPVTPTSPAQSAVATQQHPSAIAIRADATTRKDIQQLVADSIEQMGRVDIVISNVGWTEMRDFNDLDQGIIDEDWDRCFQVNVKAHLWLMHAVKPELEKNRGAFVSTASLAGVVPSGSSLPYSVTKAAQIHLMKALAMIAAPHIRVNSISPGILLTEWGKRFPQAKLDAAVEKTKLKRLADVEDVAKAVLYLAESQSITGENMVIDCGWRL